MSALQAATEVGGRICGIASPFAANEDLFLLRELLTALGADPATFAVSHGESDDLLIQAEKAPNANGARAIGFTESADPPGAAAVVIALDHALPPESFAGVDTLILLDTHESSLLRRADIVLPTRSFAEKEGSFTNHANRVQRFLPILEPSFEAWSDGEVLQRIHFLFPKILAAKERRRY